MVSFWLPWFTPGSVLDAALGLAGCLVSWLHLGSPGLPASAVSSPGPGKFTSTMATSRGESAGSVGSISISAMACLASSVEARSSFSWLTPGVQGSSFGWFILSDSLEDSELLGSGLAAAAAAAAGSSLPFCLA